MASTVSELPDGGPDDSGLTPRQQAILRVIEETMADRGYPPSVPNPFFNIKHIQSWHTLSYAYDQFYAGFSCL